MRPYVLLSILIALGAVPSPGDRFTRPLGFALAADIPLSDVQQKLGPATMISKADESDTRLCYIASAQHLILEFASGELGGPDHELLEFVMAAENVETLSGCSRLAPAVAKGLKFDVGGLHIGMTRRQFNRAVRPTAAAGNEYARMFEYTIPMPAADVTEKATELGRALTPEERHYEAVIFVRGQFRGDRLVRLQINKALTW